MANTTPKKVSDSLEAIRKRKNRRDLKERRRKQAFVNNYIENKYPDIYVEISALYEKLAERYPARADLSKTYFYKKWLRENMLPVNQQQPQPSTVNQQPKASTVNRQQSETSTSTQQQPQTSPSNQQQIQLYVPVLPILEKMGITEQGQGSPKIPPLEETTQEPPKIPSQEIKPENNTLCSGMTLEEMSVAAEEIVQTLQSDVDLMDIVEKLDLSECLWNNELSIPDYVLEGELEWW